MKWIFWTLVLANAGYFIWQTTQQTAMTPVKRGAGDVNGPPALELLSEREGQSVRDIEVEHVLSNPVVANEEELDDQLCSRLGPFDDVRSAQNIAERISAIGATVDLRAVDQATGRFDYRVVMPPFPSRQEAFRKLRELKSREIDSYVITQGPTAQGISLGVFSTEKAARTHIGWLKKEGYEARLKTIERVSRSYWIYQPPGDPLPPGSLETTRQDFPAIQAMKSPCLN